MKAFKFILLLGKSGSGKGTQAEFLTKKFGLYYLSSGNILRNRWKKNDFVGKKLKWIMEHGELVPTPMIFDLWLHALESLRKKKGFKGVVFEGSPRKLYEAYLLDEVLNFYGWDRYLKVFQVKIPDKEAVKRLLLRGRTDDEIKAIKNRLAWYKKDVEPVVSFYRKKGVLTVIDGEQSVEKVRKDIFANLRDFS